MNLKVKQIKQTNKFKNTFKKLPKKYKLLIDQEIKKIIKNPYLGEKKKGDLAYLYVHKFKINQQQLLLGYHFEDSQLILTLLHLSTHENFYRDIKQVSVK
ncbi:type II toxin-antitoxin system RelE/ParE family toxin [Thiotrichales bacterium 19X7-9]|nr:type II toxin-antitoxin system RelE/ParE family toxin [Thiotrichales bacterium 19X7-9]